jgi:serine/threonine protein kinase
MEQVPLSANLQPIPTGNVPVQLGSGTITRILGKGGVAVVYEIWNPRLEMHRAVKLLRPERKHVLKQFEYEMKISAQLRHPNIVEIHAVGEWNSLPYIEMEKIDGQDLEVFIRERGFFPIPVVVSIALMIARALSFAHQHSYVFFGEHRTGIIHRDLKPSNIMIDKKAVVKLMDFGIATPPNLVPDTSSDATISGTLHYLAPEQLKGEKLDFCSDIYSIGVIMYQMAAGRRPFKAKEINDLVQLRMNNTYTPIEDYCDSIPPRLKNLIERCMSATPEDRPQNAARLHDELWILLKKLTDAAPEEVLRRFLEGERIPGRSRHGIAMALAGTIIAFGVGAGLTGSVMSLLKRTSVPDHAVEVLQPAVQQPVPSDVKTEVKRERVSTPGIDNQIVPGKQIHRTVRPPVSKSKRNAAAGQTKSKAAPVVQPAETAPSWPEKAGDEQMIARMRAMLDNGDFQNLEEIMAANTIDDGEYYLIKAQLYCNRGRCNDGMALLNRASKITAQYMVADELRRRILVARAVCLTSLFGQEPVKERADAAMEAWYLVKYQYRSMQNNPSFIQADRELRRISEQVNATGPVLR